MQISNIAFFFSCILCAVSVDVPMLAIARILLGVAGSVPNALAGGFVADLIPLEKRASSLALLAAGVLSVRSLSQAVSIFANLYSATGHSGRYVHIYALLHNRP